MRARASLRGIYCIRQLSTERVYVGAASNIQQRFRKHKRDLLSGSHPTPLLQAAWNASGSLDFEFEIMEIVPTEKPLRPREDHWMRVYGRDRLFNANFVNRLGPDTKLHLSQAEREAWDARYARGDAQLSYTARRSVARGTRRWASRPGVRERMREAAIESNAAERNFRNPAALAKNRAALTGKAKSPAHRAAMRAAHSSGTCRCHPKKPMEDGKWMPKDHP